MNDNDYYNDTFYLKLKYIRLTNEKGKITVQYVASPTEENPISEVTSKEINSKQGFNFSKIEGNLGKKFISFGQKVACLMLPKEKGIRQEFKNAWANHKKIRLCLLYPKEESQADKLLEIPWEYIYLPKDSSNDFNKDCLLGLNHDISIVHWLYPYRKLNPSVRDLRVQMKYLSWFPAEQKEQEKRIFNDFLNETPKLTPVIHCTNIRGSELERIHSEPTDVVIALQLQNHHFIQVTAHGGNKGIVLEKDETLTPSELPIPSVKGALFLNCNSADGYSAVRQLYQNGVPMVIGMAHSIDIPPASRFVDGFYKTIATWPSHGLEKAVVYGRESIFRGNSSMYSHQFGIPRLFLNGEHSTLIPEKLLYGSDEMIVGFGQEIEELIEKANTPPDQDTPPTKKEAFQKDQKALIKDVNRLINWVKTESNQRWYLVAGPSGSGKSTVTAKFVNEYLLGLPVLKAKLERNEIKEEEIEGLKKKLESHIPKLIYHFCLERQLKIGDEKHLDRLLDTTDPLDFVRYSLVPQLVDLYGDDYKSWCRLGEFPLLVHNAEVAFDYFVLGPLRKLHTKGKEPPVIVIDALDLIPYDRHPNDTILHLLLHYKDDLAEVARFIITTDLVDEEEIEKAVETKEKVQTVLKEIYNLTGHHNQASVFIVGSSDGDEEPTKSVILFEKMQDRFYETFKSNRFLKILANDWNKLFETAINVAKRRYKACGKTKKLDYEEIKVNRLLDVVAVAYEPLSPCNVAAIIGLKFDSNEMQHLFKVLRPFFKQDNPGNLDDDTLIFYHDRFKAYILYDMNLWHRRTTAFIHEQFVEAFCPPRSKWAKITDWSTLSKTNWQNLSSPCLADPMSRYVKRYLSRHAFQSYETTPWRYRSKCQKRAKRFLSLICDPGYRIVRLAEVGHKESIQDLLNGLHVIYTEHIHKLSLEEPYEGNFEPKKHNKQARQAFQRLLEANKPGSYQQRKLIKLEEKFRNATGVENRKEIEAFLFD